MWVDLCTCIKWFWDVIFTQRISPFCLLSVLHYPEFFRWWFFAKFEFFWTVSGSIIDGCKDLKGVFFTLYFIQHSIDTVQVQHSWFFLRTHWQERLHQPQQPRVLSVLVPSAKKTSAAKSQDYEFVLIIQWSSVKHLALEIWYPMVWISH